MPPLVVTQADNRTPVVGALFAGLAFFLVQRVPSRTSFIDKIQANGGRVVRLEAQADHIIADHVRNDCPPGSISYTFIEHAIRNSALPDPSKHKAGPPAGAIRDVGSVVPGRSTRTPFTPEDDVVLWQWVERMRQTGGSIKGNEIYKQLEAYNPRHTFQAWRDRYIKRLMDRPPAGAEVTVAASAPPSPPNAPDREAEMAAAADTGRQELAMHEKRHEVSQNGAHTRASTEVTFKLPRASQAGSPTFRLPRGFQPVLDGPYTSSQGAAKPDSQTDLPKQNDDVVSKGKEEDYFDGDDFNALMSAAEDIEGLPEETRETAWNSFAENYSDHTALAWRSFWEGKVRPAFMRQQKKRQRAKRESKTRASLHNQLSAVSPNPKAEAAAAPKSRDSPQTANALFEVESSGSHKRKRDSLSSSSKSTYGRKKEKLTRSDIFDDASDVEDQFVVKQPQTPLGKGVTQQPTDEWIDENGEDEDDDEALEGEHRSLLTAQVDQAADEQVDIRDEVNRDVNRAGNSLQVGFKLPTSKANRAAERQLRQESLEPAPESEVDGDSIQSQGAASHPRSAVSKPNDVIISTHMIEDGEVEDGLPGEAVNEADGLGTALTEANLASQQAQHNAQLLRGADLPEDNEMHDQSEYVEFLQSVIKQKTTSRAMEEPLKPATPVVRELLVDGGELTHDGIEKAPSFAEHDVSRRIVAPKSHELHLTSEQELDEVLAANSDWPYSPEARKQRSAMESESRSLQFETQIAYQRVTSQEAARVGDTFMSQLSQADAEPEILHPRSRALGKRNEVDTGLSVSPRVRMQTQQHTLLDEDEDEDDQDMLVGEDEDLLLHDLNSGDAEANEGDEVYLEIPEPDGGFGFSSSPAKSVASQPQRAATEERSTTFAVRHELDEESGRNVADADEDVDVEDGGRAAVLDAAVEDVFDEQDHVDATMFDPTLVMELDAEDDEIDFTVPEPEGGFGLSSSPAKSSVSRSVHDGMEEELAAVRAQPQLIGDRESEDDEGGDVIETQTAGLRYGERDLEMQGARAHEAIEVSSVSSLSSSYESEEGSASESRRVLPTKPARAVETQDILDAETQQPDLTMPLPPDSDEESEELPSDPLRAPSGVSEPARPVARSEWLHGQPQRTQRFVQATPTPRSSLPSKQERPSASTLRQSAQASPAFQQTSRSQPIKPARAQALKDADVDGYIATMTTRGYEEMDIISALKCTSMRPELAELVLRDGRMGRGFPNDTPGVWSEDEDKAIESGDATLMREIATKHGGNEFNARLQFLEAWRSS